MTTLFDWLTTIGMIFIKPFPKTFLSESGKAKGKLPSAIAWIVLIVISFHLLLYIAYRFVYPVFTILASILLVPVIFLFYVFCVHILYKRLFHRKADHYDELLYLMVSIFVPFTLVAILLLLIPKVGSALSIISMIYAVMLVAIAVKTITKLSIAKALITVIFGTLIALLGYILIPAFVFGLMNTVPKAF